MSDIVTDRMRKVKSILVTQEAPADANSPYLKLTEKYNLKIDFRPFIQVEPVPVKEFRKQKIEILNHTAIIFTSRNAVDHFFHICQELKIEMPPEMKYFCISEQTSNYLQKYIVIRKAQDLHRPQNGAGPSGNAEEAQERKIPFPLLRYPQK